jgi:DNA-binding transcriptional regulator YiaG
MPNIVVVLKSEISRIARKEIRGENLALRKAVTTHRREIAALKRKIAQLDRQTTALGKVSRRPTAAESDTKTPTRFVAKGLVSMRKRLALSAADLARLLNVSMQSIYNWERKKATPRKEQVAAVVALRGVSKNEAHRRLAELDGPVKKGATAQRSTTARSSGPISKAKQTPRTKRARAK